MHFADSIIEACEAKDSRLVVGLDPHWHMIPDAYKQGVAPKDAIARFLTEAVDVTLEHAVAYKPQIAFFEQFGTAGMQALDVVLAHIADAGGLVIMDAKRGDIGSTAQAYARAFFGDDALPAAWPSNALTVNGYLGSDGIKPFMGRPDKGIFVLVKTSNPSSGELQDKELSESGTVAHQMARAVDAWNKESVGSHGYGNVGAVIGATYPEHMRALRAEMPQSLLLVPGYGAQGGAEEAVSAAFDDQGFGALINSSRGILFPKDLAERGAAAQANAAAEAREHITRLAKA